VVGLLGILHHNFAASVLATLPAMVRRISP
jgi:hypothetical protein